MITMDNLTKHLNDLIRKITEKDDPIANLTTALHTTNPNNAPAIRTTTTTRRKTTDPDKFSADQTTAEKRQSAYESWSVQIDAILLQDTNYFPTNRDKIIHICSRLGGTAFEHVKEGLKTIIEHPNDDTKWTWNTVKHLRKILDSRYILIDPSQTARNKLDKCWQRGREYQNWKSEVDDLMTRAKITDEQKVDFLTK
ncbi:hypothetical protein V8F06_014908, partial [Rhypophila decipiens]